MRALIRIGCCAALVLLPLILRAQERETSKPLASTQRSTDEAVIRANVQAFVKAFNAGDAQAVSRLFAPEAQLIDEEGNTTQGREAISKTFAGIFAEAPQSRMEVTISSVRFIGSALAIETGQTKVTRKPGDAAETNHYSAVHVKSRTGQWMMGFVHDTPGTDISNHDRLQPLEWMIGDWIDESHESIVLSSCKWAPNKNYLLAEIRVRMQGRDAMNLSQRIGWDPLTKQIKSWVFDSEGGYGESLWTHDGNHWIAKANGVRRDGTISSATNIFTPSGKDAYTWRSVDRIVAGEVQPPMEVKVVRKPPEPRGQR